MNNILNYVKLDNSILDFPKPLDISKKKDDNNYNLVKLCFTPNELFGAAIAQPMGYIAERIISFQLVDFFTQNKIVVNDIYTDYSFAGKIDKELIGFLIQKNPTISKEAIDEISISPIKRPDILISSNKLKVYYEIKPNSSNGKSKGRKKLESIGSFFSKYNLLYKKGSLINGLREFNLIDTTLKINDKIIPFKATFTFNQEDGLILYKICITTDWEFIINTGNTDLVLHELYKFFKDIIEKQIKIKEKINNLLDNLSDIPIIEILLISSLILGVTYLALTSTLITAFSVALISLEATAKESLGLKNKSVI